MAFEAFGIKLNDTRKIVAQGQQLSGQSSLDPYFAIGGGNWSTFNGGKLAGNQGILPEATSQIRMGTQGINMVHAIADYLGYMIEVEGMVAGETLSIGVPGQNFYGKIIENGRFHGKCYLDQPAFPTYIWVTRENALGSHAIIVKEFFLFNATINSYEDFLESPISYLSVEQKNAPDSIDATSPRLGWADAIPTTGSWRVGDRLENTAWTGLFSSTIAWVCTSAGTPGTWKAVTLFDSWAASKDPYFQSFIGVNWWTNQSTSPATSVIDANGLTILVGSGAQPTGASILAECAVRYELVTVEYLITAKVGNNISYLQNGSDAVNRVVLNNPTVPVSGTQDFTLAVTTPEDKRFWIYSNLNNSSGMTFRKALSRPKYPFLTKAPASFAALPSVRPANLSPHTWYLQTAGPTYAAGEITVASSGQIVQQSPNLYYAGKVIRFRCNIVTLTAGALPYCYTLGMDGTTNQFAVPVATGIQEITITLTRTVREVRFGNHSSATASFSFNYVRFYAE